MSTNPRNRPNVDKMRKAMRRDRLHALSRGDIGPWDVYLRLAWSRRAA